MTKIEINFAMTENQKEWFKKLLECEATEALDSAKHSHLCALGSESMEFATLHELNADEQRGYAKFLYALRDVI